MKHPKLWRSASTWSARILTVALVSPAPAWAQVDVQSLTPDQRWFYKVYKELVETNTTHSVGSTTVAAKQLAAHLREAGLPSSDIQIFEPFERKGNIVARFKGDGSKRPLLLLGHLDVVEAKAEDWKLNPFKLNEEGGYFTARGAIDDKAKVAAYVSAVAQLKREGIVPKRDIVMVFTADEERLDVPSNGAKWLAANHPGLLQAEFGLNEGGGGLLKNGKPYVNRIQLAEKVSVTYEYSVSNKGGHSAWPRSDNAIYELTDALNRVASYRFPANPGEAVKVFLRRSAALESGQQAQDMLAVAQGQADDAVIERLTKDVLYNAQLRTTCVATMVNAGHAENALAQSAKSTINCRVLPHEDPSVVDAKLRELAGSNVTVTMVNPPLKSPPSPMRDDVLGAVEDVTQQMWPGVPVIPTMSNGATDSRYLRNLGVPIYGVTGLFTDSPNGTHGLNERIEIKRLFEGREFIYQLIKRLAN